MQAGDRIQLQYHDEMLDGVLMPSTDEHIIVLKLDNGYNIGLKKRDVASMTVLGKAPTEKQTFPNQERTDLPVVSILHTGGTIASKVDYTTGGVSSRFSPEELLELFPELGSIASIRSRLIANMWSQDLRFGHYNKLAEEVKKELAEGVQGIIITHGTDTMHYTAAALSFILENIPVPVVLVGSQRSSDRGSSDAGMNLLNAVFFAAHANFSGVVICMHHSSNDDGCAILPGTKTKKMHSSRRDAFKAINAQPVAFVNHGTKTITFNSTHYLQRHDGKINLKLIDGNIKVGVLKQHTHMHAEEFLFYKDYDGLVIESTGLGNLPITAFDELTKEHEHIMLALQKLIHQGVIIVLSPETIFGRLNLNVYENARRQQQAGILGHNNDMTTETTFIKLAWLLSNYDKQQAKDLLLKNLRGELAERTSYTDDFLQDDAS
ncbi:MAG: Glu-tRNA(Gln) amidotransferase subunit GatD [archaeon]